MSFISYQRAIPNVQREKVKVFNMYKFGNFPSKRNFLFLDCVIRNDQGIMVE